MAEEYTYDGGTLGTVREQTTELTLSAELGQVGSGRFTIDDSDGDIEIVGQKDFAHTEDDCATPLTFSGFVADRTYKRGATMSATARDIEVSLVDLNAMLGFLLIDDTDGNRPSETVAARGAWLLGSDYVSFTDNGRCSFSSTVMDKADYRYQYAGDVLADMALAQTDVNYHVNDYGSGPELTFRNDNTSTADSCTLRISNVLADANSTTLHPFKDATLTRSPANVYSKVAYSYAKGTQVRERTATATAFNGERGGTASNSNVKTATAARDEADALLHQHHTEEDTIECTVLTTSAQVNLIPPGWRIQAKFSHLATEGYGSFTWFRILEVTRKPIVADGALYEVKLRLSPQEPADIPGDCVDLYPGTPSGTYYPLGGVSGGPVANPSDGVVYYFRPGLYEPLVPTPGYIGTWHFGVWGSGGAGSIDYAGDCVGSSLILMTVGNGTWTIQTEPGAALRSLNVSSGPPGFGAQVLRTVITSGDSVEVVIDDATDGDCIRWVTINDTAAACGSNWGWSQGEWVAT